jgi:hypothetical protein
MAASSATTAACRVDSACGIAVRTAARFGAISGSCERASERRSSRSSGSRRAFGFGQRLIDPDGSPGRVSVRGGRLNGGFSAQGALSALVHHDAHLTKTTQATPQWRSHMTRL